MDELEFRFSEIVIFEVPSREDSHAFGARLRPRFPGWSLVDGEVWLFAADLADASGDLAELLRECQELLAERGMSAIRFVLDGRVYFLDPAEPVYERTGKSEQAA